MERRLELNKLERVLVEVRLEDKEGRVVKEARQPESGQLQATVPALIGAHSEAQIIATLAAGDRLVATLSPIPPYAMMLTGLQADAPPMTFYVTALVTPDIIPHAGWISPALVHVVHENFKLVMPLVSKGASAKFLIENRSATAEELEVVVGLVVGFEETLLKLRERRMIW